MQVAFQVFFNYIFMTVRKKESKSANSFHRSLKSRTELTELDSKVLQSCHKPPLLYLQIL